MSVAPSEALERSVLEGKDREQLLAIAAALGVKPAARAKKADIIDKILEQVGVPAAGGSAEPAAAPAARKAARPRAGREAEPAVELDFAAAAADASGDGEGSAAADASAEPVAAASPAPTRPAPAVVLGPDGEPLAEWELELAANGDASADEGDDDGDEGDDEPGGQGGTGAPGEVREGRRRRRRRNRNRGADGEGGQGAPGGPPAAACAAEQAPVRPAASPAPERTEEHRVDGEYAANEPVAVAGFVDLREEGFGFLRVRGYLATKDDIYVSVKQVRQYGLRKGDHVEGTSRAAGRNEKNPALLTIAAINGGDPEAARLRRRFDDLTPVFPDEPLRLEDASDPANVTARVVDLVAPIGKGQRGLVAAPPRSGRTTVLKELATALEHVHPDVRLVVLLVDERPEEVTDVRRAVGGEVIASTFDAKPADHAHVAEMAVERAKRLVEAGEDVVVIADGLTRLARAYNLSAPASGKVVAGGIDAGALHLTKRFFGAARKLAEGGSLTIVATASVDTGSKADEAIYDELIGTANMELRLERHLAERRVFPAIDVASSSTRHEELLFGADVDAARSLRAALLAEAAQGTAPSAVELLAARLEAAGSAAAVLAAARR